MNLVIIISFSTNLLAMDSSGFLKLIKEKLRVNSTDEQLVSYLRGVRNPTVWSRFDQVTSTNSLQFFSTNFPV